MPRENLAEVNLDVEPTSDHAVDPGQRTQTQPVAHSDDDPFRIAVIGDFSGRANRGSRGEQNPAPRPVLIDPDKFEDVMVSLGVSLELPDGVSMRFRELDDFHPDQIYEHLPMFRAFREAKKELANPQTFRAAAEKLRPPHPAPAAPAPPPRESSGSLLDDILSGSESNGPAAAPARRASARDPWDEAIGKIVARHAIPNPDPRQEEMIANVDAAATAQLRAILHHPDFQNLEAAWRSLFFLLSHLETGVELKIYLIDLSREEFLNGDPALTRLLTESAVGDHPWSVIAGLYTFAPGERDCAALARMATLARRAGAPFLAGMSPRLFGCESIATSNDPDDWKDELPPEELKAWQELRRSPDARWVGLAMPRFLLRLPYGKKTAPLEAFDFEEMPETPVHDSYLWANPSMACICLLGEAFDRMGWELQPDAIKRIDSMPVHVLPFGDATPPAEIWMTERFAAKMLDEGIMPLASVKHTDAVLLVRFQSIADPQRSLPGPWAR